MSEIRVSLNLARRLSDFIIFYYEYINTYIQWFIPRNIKYENARDEGDNEYDDTTEWKIEEK